MKRCPECDFIYENDQRFCDMDGRELPSAPRPLLPTGVMVAKPPARLVKSQRRRLVVRVAAALILGAVLFLAFYGFMHRIPAQNIVFSSAKVLASSTAPNAVLATRSSALTERNTLSPMETSDVSVDDVPTLHSARAKSIAPRYRPPVRRRQAPKSDANQANHKKESKVGSFFRKTGRLLKKPFSF